MGIFDWAVRPGIMETSDWQECRDQTDSDDDTESNGKFKEKELKESSSHFPTVMYSVDGPNIKDIDTNSCSISIPDNIGLSQTANLPSKLKLCVGARVMLTDNIGVSDRLINSSLGTVST